MDPSLLGGVLLSPVLQRGPTVSVYCFFLDAEGLKANTKCIKKSLFIVILDGIPLILG